MITGLSGKKGNAFFDTLTIVIVLFVFIVVMLFGYKLITDFNTEIQASTVSADTKEMVSNLQTNYPSFMDYIVLTALVLLWIVAIIMSFLVDSHPVFLVITILLIVFVLFFAGILANTYEEIAQEGDLSPASFPISNWILSHLVMIVTIIGFSIALSLYAKSQIGGGGIGGL